MKGSSPDNDIVNSINLEEDGNNEQCPSSPVNERSINKMLPETNKKKSKWTEEETFDEIPGIPGSIVNNNGIIHKKDEVEVFQVYKRRWIILGLFVLYSTSNAFQWIQYAIINDIIVRFYDIAPEWVDWTSLIYMCCYIPLIFPATYLLQKKGLRTAVLIGSFGTALGSWIKVFSADPSLFWVTFVGQTVVAISQIFVLGIPPLLAAVWFGPNEVSKATAIGVFGNQLGVALGFVLPPMIVRSNVTIPEIGYDLGLMFYGTGTVTAVLFVLVIFFFKDKPPTPPSIAQAALLTAEPEDYLCGIKRLLTNSGYLLLLLSYGMNVGVFYAISTLLNSFILTYFENAGHDIGRIGLTIVVAGMGGSVISGFILDTTKKFKETTVVIYGLSLVGMLVYTFTLPYAGSIVLIYIVFAALGFFMTGYLPVGFEFAAEITYPESEGTSSGLLNASAQFFGIIMTPITRQILQSSLGDIGANLVLAAILLLGFLMTILIKSDLKRTHAQRLSKNPNSNSIEKIPVSFDQI